MTITDDLDIHNIVIQNVLHTSVLKPSNLYGLNYSNIKPLGEKHEVWIKHPYRNPCKMQMSQEDHSRLYYVIF